ncbi:hypothetical protein [Sneathiella sp.]|jgi:hypothetical protein|uniref:hypothetical protein n=1 Tax=Sneathiella sp. TaxID=1964365 RepID=UPI0039E62B19
MMQADEPAVKHRPAYLSRLHMRLHGAAFDNSKPKETLPLAELASLYRDQNKRLIRSKYKGKRAFSPAPDARIDTEDDQVSHTSGIPIFGNDDAAARVGWSYGHTETRSFTTQALKEHARLGGTGAYSDRFLADHATAENSHALGHGDYGTDHLLSAPPASKAQNTEQLAIELAMRAAAEKVNAEKGVGPDQSLVHAKITDVLHPHTGQLMARRFKLIRRADKNDTKGTVVFDHLMDGRRLHISRDEAFGLGERVHEALTKDPVAARKPHNESVGRKGLGDVIAPTATELRDHQYRVLRELQQAKPKNIWERAQSRDRAKVNMVGPAFTDAAFPPDDLLRLDDNTLTGESALREMRSRAVGHHPDVPEDDDEDQQISTDEAFEAVDTRFETSGSVPADGDTTLLRGVQSIRAAFKRHLGTREPSLDEIRTYPGKYQTELMEAHSIAKKSGGDRTLLRPDEQKMLEEVDALRKKIVGK